LTLSEAAERLAADSGEGTVACRAAIEAMLQAGAAVRHPDTQRPVFAFRLHQFLSKGDNVYVTLERDVRYVVPLYQRPYVWDADHQWEPLWDDIVALLQHQESGDTTGLWSHLLGAIVHGRSSTDKRTVAQHSARGA
jgi:hypothetical protein